MTIRTIKGIDESTWTKFRTMAVKNRLRTGDLFSKIVEEHDKLNNSSWERILGYGKMLTDAEAEAFINSSKSNRTEYGFRK